MDFCINCGTSIEGSMCNSCHESVISNFESDRYNYCWNCGTEYDQENSYCSNCNIAYDEIENQISYTNCPICNLEIDPNYECPYHDTCQTELEWKTGFIINVFQNQTTLNSYLKFKCIYDKDFLVSETLTNGKIRLSHKSVILLKLSSINGNENYIFDIYDYICQKFNFQKLSDNRFKKIKKDLPITINVEINLDTNAHPTATIFQSEIDNWLDKIKF